MLFRDRLGRPVNRIEALRPPGVLHAHHGMGAAKVASRVDRSEEGAEDRLNGLTMQGEASPGCLLHLVLSGPRALLLACVLVQVATRIPYLSRFHLGRFMGGARREAGRVAFIALPLRTTAQGNVQGISHPYCTMLHGCDGSSYAQERRAVFPPVTRLQTASTPHDR